MATPSALQSAIAFLRRGLRPDGAGTGIDEWDLPEYQWRLLHDWAAGTGLILPPETVPARAGGFEHDIRYVPETGRWLKFTKPSRAGVIAEIVGDKVQMFPALPLQYLQRWRLANRTLGDDVELVGLSKIGSQLRIVVSQRGLVGEAPDWEELHSLMTDRYGLRRINTTASVGGYEARAYAGDRFAVFDVRPPNFLRTAGGVVVPFDVIPRVLTRSEVAVLRALR